MEKLKIKKIEGTIAYIEGSEVEQINTADFIIFKIDEGMNPQGIKDIIKKLQERGIKKIFIVLPKGVDYCVFKQKEAYQYAT